MALITWSDGLSVRSNKIDDQHKQLIRHVNELHDAMSKGQGKEALGRILGGLISYTRSHFAMEEQLMTASKYPHMPEHKAEHDALTRQVVELQQKFAAGKIGITLEVMNFLKDWLSRHILNSDKKLGGWLTEKGMG